MLDPSTKIMRAFLRHITAARGDALIIFDFNFWRLTPHDIVRVFRSKKKSAIPSSIPRLVCNVPNVGMFGGAKVFAVLFLQLKLTTGTLPN